MPGFYTQTPEGNTIHVNGDPNMSAETAEALGRVMDAVIAQINRQEKAFAHLWDVGDRKAQGVDRDIALWWFRAGADLREMDDISKVRKLESEIDQLRIDVDCLERQNENLRESLGWTVKEA